MALPATGQTTHTFTGHSRGDSAEADSDSGSVQHVSTNPTTVAIAHQPISSRNIWQCLRGWSVGLLRCNPYEESVIASVAVWSRWTLWVTALVYLLTRANFTLADNSAIVAMLAVAAAATLVFHYRLLSNRSFEARWVLALCVIDISVIVAASSVSNVFQPIVYLGLYPVLAFAAVAISSFTVCAAWTSLVAAAYVATVLATSSGADLQPSATLALSGRVVMMFAVALAVNLVTGRDRIAKQKALERAQALQQEQIEWSQRIHDTSAQTAYMIGLGIDNAIAQATDARPELMQTLAATSELSKTAMWELRQPIDSRLIYEGQALSEVLASHTRVFSTITSLPAQFSQTGTEPPLDPQIRATVFSIGHNALTNAHRHAEATEVKIELDFSPERIRLAVSDDGIGLPDDYNVRGHGFRNMRAEAERMGGEIVVRAASSGRGTTVICILPYQSV